MVKCAHSRCSQSIRGGGKRQQGGSVNRRIVKLAAVTFVAGALALSGCGSRADTGSSSSTGATKTAKIGVIAPLSGDLSALGLGIKNSVCLLYTSDAADE